VLKKSVFDYLPYPKRSALEKEFMAYLDEKSDEEIQAYTRVLSRHPLNIPYHNPEGYLRYYRPDFVVKTPQAAYLVETKGREGVEVPIKDREALRWCENIKNLTGQEWKYLKVRPEDLENYRSHDFKTLALATTRKG